MLKTPVYTSVQHGTWNQSGGAVQHQVQSEGVDWGPLALLLAIEPYIIQRSYFDFKFFLPLQQRSQEN